MAIGTSPRKRQSLGLFRIAFALIAAATLGSSAGFIWQNLLGEEEEQPEGAVTTEQATPAS